MSSKVLIIIPTYNEAANICRQLTELNLVRLQIAENYAITFLHIDDSSPDGTAKLASEMELPNFTQIINARKVGLGPAYLRGFAWGVAHDFDLFIEIDADGSHLASQLPALLTQGLSHDLVIGARWIPGGKIENWPWYRRVISKLGTAYASKALGLPYQDLTSGYRVLSRNLIQSLDLETISTKGYGFQIEIAFQAHLNGFSIIEVPITFIERSAGQSKMSFGIVLEAFKFITKRGFQRSLRGIYRR